VPQFIVTGMLQLLREVQPATDDRLTKVIVIIVEEGLYSTPHP
jgi:hypothetical protein